MLVGCIDLGPAHHRAPAKESSSSCFPCQGDRATRATPTRAPTTAPASRSSTRPSASTASAPAPTFTAIVAKNVSSRPLDHSFFTGLNRIRPVTAREPSNDVTTAASLSVSVLDRLSAAQVAGAGPNASSAVHRHLEGQSLLGPIRLLVVVVIVVVVVVVVEKNHEGEIQRYKGGAYRWIIVLVPFMGGVNSATQYISVIIRQRIAAEMHRRRRRIERERERERERDKE